MQSVPGSIGKQVSSQKGKGPGVRLEKLRFGVIHKKVGPIRLIHCMAHGAWGMASGKIGVKSPFFPLVNFLEKK